MSNVLNIKNRLKSNNSLFPLKKKAQKVSLSLHIMPRDHESKDVKVFSWLTASLLIVASLIIFLMIS